MQPPSPIPPKVLLGKKGNAPKSPKFPNNLFSYAEPKAHAQSSIIVILFFYNIQIFLY